MCKLLKDKETLNRQMGEGISGRENKDELSQRDKSVAAHTKNRWAFRMCWQPREGGE